MIEIMFYSKDIDRTLIMYVSMTIPETGSQNGIEMLLLFVKKAIMAVVLVIMQIVFSDIVSVRLYIALIYFLDLDKLAVY